MDFDCDLSVVRDDERRGATAVHRQRCAHESIGARRQQRAAGRHRIRARSHRGRDHNPVTRHANVELPVDGHFDDELCAPSPSQDEIVDRPGNVCPAGANVERRQVACQPVAGGKAVEGCAKLVLRHRRQDPQAATGDAHHRRPGAGGCVQRLEHRSISAERDNEVAPAHFAGGRHRGLLPSWNLHKPKATALRPAPEDLHGILRRAGGMDQDSDAFHVRCSLRSTPGP